MVHVLKIPGLSEVLASVTPATHQGLLGICLSGAGPTILALATDGFDQIESTVRSVFRASGVEVVSKILEVGASSLVEAPEGL